MLKILNEILHKSLFKRIFSNFTWLIISEAVTKGIFFFTNIYIARVLGVKNFGLFTLAQAITFYLWLIVSIGTNMYGIREIAKNKDNAKEIISSLLTLRIVLGVTVFTFYSLIIWMLNITILVKLTLIGCGLYLFTYAFYTDWCLKGLEKISYIALGNTFSSVVFLLATIYFVRYNSDIIKASFIWSVSYFFGGISLLYFLFLKLKIKYKPSFDFKIWFFHIKESIFFTLSGSLLVLYRYLPILFLSLFSTSYKVGIFAAPYKLVTMVCTLGFLVPMAFYPILSEYYIKNKKTFYVIHKNFQRIMIIIGIPIAIVGTLFGEFIIKIIFGPKYIKAIYIFKILVWLVPLYFLRYSYGSVLLATGFQKFHNLASFIGVFSMCIIGLLCISKYGVIGAAWSILIAELCLVIAMAIVSYKTFLQYSTNI